MMMNRSRKLWCAGMFLLAGVFGVNAVELAEDAPELTPSEWLKGEALSLAQCKGKKSVVVIFYDSYHPLSRPMFQRMNDLAREYADAVQFVAVSVESPENVKSSELFPQISFHVATDSGDFAKSYLGDREQPQMAFLVDPAGKVAWIGSPLVLAEPLEQVVTGDYDLNQVAAPVEDREKIDDFLLNGNYADAIKTIDLMLSRSSDDGLIALKARILFAMQKRPEEGLAYLKSEIERQPGNYTLRLLLVAMYRELGNYKQVDACYLELAKDFQDRPEWLRHEAESILKLSMEKMNLGPALVLARSAWDSPALTDRQEKARIAQVLAQIYSYVGRLDLAVPMQQEAVNLFVPTSPQAQKALLLLQYYENALAVGKGL